MILLTDNAELKIEDSIVYIEEIIENVISTNPQTVFILQAQPDLQPKILCNSD